MTSQTESPGSPDALSTIVRLADRLHSAASDPEHSEMAARIAAIARSLMPEPDRRPAQEPAVAAAPSPREFAILIADDNPTTRMLAGKILTRAGHRVTAVDDGNAALLALRDAAFDAVLMDLEMPGMNGVEAAKLYRFASIGRARMPIIGLVARDDEATRDTCVEAGMDGCLAKPIDPALLLRTLDEVLSPEAAATPAGETVVAFAGQTAHAPADDSVVDMETLANLERLGGKAFVGELVSQFSHDAREHLRQLGAAAAGQDVHEFREVAHALRSSAANVGATRIFEMCLAVRAIAANQLASDGPGLVRQVGEELDRALAALQEQVGRFAA